MIVKILLSHYYDILIKKHISLIINFLINLFFYIQQVKKLVLESFKLHI